MGWVHMSVPGISGDGVGCNGHLGWYLGGQRRLLETCLHAGRRDATAVGTAALSLLPPQSLQPLRGWQRAHV